MKLDLTYEEIQILPELANLEVLDAVLQTTIRALQAVHPKLADNEGNFFTSVTVSACAADAIIHLSRTLMHAIDRYRRINYRRLQPLPNPSHTSDSF